MYHYVNRPGLSTQRSRQIIAQFFNTSVNGLPGNDGACFPSLARGGVTDPSLQTPVRIAYEVDTTINDSNHLSGAMGSYVAFYLAGMYPLPGTRQFLISSPFFQPSPSADSAEFHQ